MRGLRRHLPTKCLLVSVLPQNNEALRDIPHHTHILIATGERMFRRWQYKNLLETGYVDIIQTDLSRAGSFSECWKVVAMGEMYAERS